MTIHIHHEVSMSLRSSTAYEISGISPPQAISSIRHSRARGNPGLLSAELAWIPAFAGMTEPRRYLLFTEHPPIGIFEGEHEGHEG